MFIYIQIYFLYKLKHFHFALNYTMPSAYNFHSGKHIPCYIVLTMKLVFLNFYAGDTMVVNLLHFYYFMRKRTVYTHLKEEYHLL